MRKTLKYMIIIPALLTLMLIAGTSASALSAAPSQSVYYPGQQLVVQGSATPNALLSIVVYNPNNQMVALDQAKAGADGSFTDTVLTFPSEPTQTLPYGTYTVNVKDTATNEETSFTVTYEQAEATIQGTVVSEEGAPIAGATITVKLGTVTVAVLATNQSGSFSVDVTNTGTYTIEVSATGYVSKTTQVNVTSLPSTATVQVTLKEETLSVEIESILANGKPMVGVAREGQTLVITAKVYYGGSEVSNATINGYLTSGVRQVAGLPPMEFQLSYDSNVGAYIGTIMLPSPGVDRTSTINITASYGDMMSYVERSFITLVNTPETVSNVVSQVNSLSNQVGNLSKTITGLQSNIGTLHNNLNSLQNTVNSLQSTVSSLQATVNSLQSQIGNLAAKQDVTNLRNQLTQLQTQLTGLQDQIKTLQTQVSAVSGARGIAWGAIAIGIIAIIIAIAALGYMNKKIQG